MNIEELTIYPAVKLEILLAEFENGARPKGGVGQIEEGVPSLGGEHLTADGGFRFENVRYISEKFFRSMKKGIVRHQDILIVKDGATTGKVAFVRQDFPFERAAINEHLFRLRAKPELVKPEYLFWFLFSDWGQVQIQRSFQGGAIGGINQSFVRRVDVPLPPLPEQRRIVAILRKADELRQLRQRANQRARDLLPAVFYAMFGEPYKNPKKYPVRNLGTILKDIRYGTSTPPPYVSKGIPFIRATNISKGYISPRDIKYISQESANEISKCYVNAGDLILVRSGAYTGDCARVPEEFDGAYAAYDLILTPDNNRVLSEVIETFLLSPYGQAQINRVKIRSGQPHLNAQDAANLKFPNPPLEKQVRFAKVYHHLKSNLMASSEKTFETYTVLLTALLARAFTGELTAAWREAHADELRAAAAERDRLLAQRQKPVQVLVETTGDIQAIAASMRNFHALVEQLTTDAAQSLSTFTHWAESLRPHLEPLAAEVNRQLAEALSPLAEVVNRQLAASVQPLTEALRARNQSTFAALAEKIALLARLELDEPIPRREVEARVLAVAQSKEGHLSLPALAADWRLNHFPRQTIQEAVDMLVLRGQLRPVTLRVETGDPARPYALLSAYALVREDERIAADEIDL